MLTPSHIPYLSGTDCSSCHSSTTYAVGGFGPMNMTQATHAFVVTSCDTCHEAGLSFYMGAASPALQGRPADHTTAAMMAPNDCSQCHTTANWNSNSMPAGHMPNPANQACSVCHTTAPADYTTTTLAANAVLHTGITSGCITCHGAPNSTPPVFYPNYTPKDAVLSPVHIPTSTTACEACHSPTVFTAFSGTTMTSAKHTSMFAVIGKSCDACHESTTPKLSFYGVTNLTVRPSGHHVGQDCSGCHNTNNWDGGAQQRAATKTAARNMVVTVVKPPAGAMGATGGPATACCAAHRYTARRPAGDRRADPIPRDERILGVARRRDRQLRQLPQRRAGRGQGRRPHREQQRLRELPHDLGVDPGALRAPRHHGELLELPQRRGGAGQAGRARPVHQRLRACHGTFAWLPATFSHFGISATCLSCHNGLTATGKQAQHAVTSLDCAACHTTLNWTVATPARTPLRPLLSKPVSRGPTIERRK